MDEDCFKKKKTHTVLLLYAQLSDVSPGNVNIGQCGFMVDVIYTGIFICLCGQGLSSRGWMGVCTVSWEQTFLYSSVTIHLPCIKFLFFIQSVV